MNYTELNEITKKKALLENNIQSECFEYKGILYFDETNNIKKLTAEYDDFIKKYDTHFILGGIAIEKEPTIKFEELQYLLNLQKNTKEVKSSHIFKGDFIDCLKSDKLSKFLHLVLDNNWKIHFSHLDVFYYSIVDIVDSCKSQIIYKRNKELKTTLYLILKENIQATASLFSKYEYPNIPLDKKNDFIDDLIKIIDKSSLKKKRFLSSRIVLLKSILQDMKKEKKLIFIQDNFDENLISRMGDFYHKYIYIFKDANLVFDEETDVQIFLSDKIVQVNNIEIKNWKMVNSKAEPMIQCSDVIVGLLGKYFKFITRNLTEILYDVEKFDSKQKECFLLFNKVIKKSVEYNPAFICNISGIHVVENMTILFSKYGT